MLLLEHISQGPEGYAKHIFNGNRLKIGRFYLANNLNLDEIEKGYCQILATPFSYTKEV